MSWNLKVKVLKYHPVKLKYKQEVLLQWSPNVPWHLKVKEKDISLTKHYSITISIQKISSIHKFILNIQQILGSHELRRHGHFWPCPPKNHWMNFLLSWICTSKQKSVRSICSGFEIQLVLDSHDQTGHTHFWPCSSKKKFDQHLFLGICINMQKISCSIYSFIRYSQF